MATTTIDASLLLHGAQHIFGLSHGWKQPCRFTAQQERSLVSAEAWHPGVFRQMMKTSAGMVLRFVSDGTSFELGIRTHELPSASEAVLRDVRAHNEASSYARDGVAIFRDGECIADYALDELGAFGGNLSFESAAEATGEKQSKLPGFGEAHEFAIYLPAFTSCELKELACDGSFIEPVSREESLLVLGDSVAQGFCSGSPAKNWPALLTEHLHADLLNQSLGAQVFQASSLDVLEHAGNITNVCVAFGLNYRFEAYATDRLRRDIKNYFQRVHELFGQARVWVLGRTHYTEALYTNHAQSPIDVLDGLLQEELAAYSNFTFVDGLWVMETRDELLADGSDHPTAEGHAQIATHLAALMKQELCGHEKWSAALEVLEAAPEAAFPLLECVRRRIGELLFVNEKCELLLLEGSFAMLWASDQRLAGRVLRDFAPFKMLCVCGRDSVDVAKRNCGFSVALPCHVSMLEGDLSPEIYAELEDDVSNGAIRVLDESYEELIYERYSHPEYLVAGELKALLNRGAILGAFSDGELCGFIGEHPEGSIGMLEVFPGYRRQGLAMKLAHAKAAEQLARGCTPWGEIWPSNVASLALQEKLGLRVYPAQDLVFLADS